MTTRLTQQSYEQFVNFFEVGSPRMFKQGWANCEFLAEQVAEELTARQPMNFSVRTSDGKDVTVKGWRLTHEFMDNGYKYFVDRWGGLYREGSKADRRNGQVRRLTGAHINGLKEYRHLFVLLGEHTDTYIDPSLVTST